MPSGPPLNHQASRDGTSGNHGRSLVPNELIDGCGNRNYSDVHPGANFSANPHPNTHSPSDYHHPYPSANSWVSGNSFTSTNPPLSALLPPSWPNHQSNNSVPSPPHNQHDYQRPGSTSAAMARLELTLHHHIDSTAGSLSRLITDKHDRIMDQTIRRLENIEETVIKGFRDLKADLKDVRKDVDGLRGEVKDTMESSKKVQGFLHMLDGKLEALEKGVEEHSCKCQLAAADRSPSMPESAHEQESALHRRTESAHGALGQGEQRQQYRSGASRSSTSARQSGNSNRPRRSNTSNIQPRNRTSDELDTRREYFAELGAARGPMPDLRDHPAFSGMQQAQGQIYSHDQDAMSSVLDGLPYVPPSLGDGHWYQQAYGQKQ